MSKKILILVLVCILIFPLGLNAKEKKGADLIIQKKDGIQVRGELIAVKQNSLLLQERESGADVTVDIADVGVITIKGKSKGWEGMGLGLLIGGGIGVGVAAAVVPSGYSTSGIAVAGIVALGAVLGLLIGGYMGTTLGKDKAIQIEGNSDSEIQEILEKLRKKARITEYQ